ncbi:PREDICTED: claudin-6-like [Elephantulus edwardii]|uniref:claudin-6-like n=1 Tax=Elephantulus edwardii TaxID=28737 RepID=UPI0003F05DD3|nr:PREDICTED: claudin-6-like [Elephantulus edwardii]
MASTGLQILGLVLTLLGWVNALVSCTLPMWKATAFIGSSIMVVQVIWEELWMSYAVQSTGQMQCKVYNSLLALPQAAHALCVITLLVTLVYIAGAKYTTCVEDKDFKTRLVLTSVIIFIISGVLALILTCWTANFIIRDFYNPLEAEAQKREPGASLCLDWAASGLLLLGGALLCCARPSGGSWSTNHYMVRYSASAPQGTPRPTEYPTKNYV